MELIIKLILGFGILVIYFPRLKHIPASLRTKKGVILFSLELGVVFVAVAQLIYLPIPLNWLSFAGVILYMFGVVTATTARFQMRESYVPAMSFTASRPLVTKGMFSIIRHPVYLGMIFAFTGAELAFSVLLGVIGLLLSSSILIWQLNKEELILSSKYDQGWKAYSQRVRYRLIPGLY